VPRGLLDVAAVTEHDLVQTQAAHVRCDAVYFPYQVSRCATLCWSAQATGMLSPRPVVIQVGPLFAEHRHTLPGVPVAGKGPANLGESWKPSAQGQSRAIAPPASSLPRHTQRAHSMRQRCAARTANGSSPSLSPRQVGGLLLQQGSTLLPPIMLKSAVNPGGLPMEVFDKIRRRCRWRSVPVL